MCLKKLFILFDLLIRLLPNDIFFLLIQSILSMNKQKNYICVSENWYSCYYIVSGYQKKKDTIIIKIFCICIFILVVTQYLNKYCVNVFSFMYYKNWCRWYLCIYFKGDMMCICVIIFWFQSNMYIYVFGC